MQWLWGRITELNEKDYAAVYTALSVSRKAHIDKLKHAEARRRSLMASYVTQRLLEKSGIPNAVLETDDSGKPYLSGCAWYVSISHSADMVVCAVDEAPIGVDVEHMKPVERKLIDYVCTDEERAYVLERDEETVVRFFEVWTAKEASYKHDGGITPLRAINALTLKKYTCVIDEYYITIV